MLANTTVTSDWRKPRPYQHDGIAWLYNGRRKFLTDGFGLGKTCQAIWAAETPALIAVPGHMLNHWRREILACKPGARVIVADKPTTVGRKRQLQWTADYYVVPIEILRTEMTTWFGPLMPVWQIPLVPLAKMLSPVTGIRTFIVDEAHRLRGRDSQQSRGADEVCQLVPRVYFLTATPVYNVPSDLYATLHMLDPRRFRSYWLFCEEFLSIHQTPWGPKTMGLRRRGRLKQIFKEYAMGRTRAEVRAQLPALQETLVELEPDKAWYKVYEKLKWEYKDLLGKQLTTRQSVLQVLRGYTQQAKLQAVCELIADGCSDNTVVYTYHRDLAEALAHLLKCPAITGDMKPAEREAVARGHDFIVATFPSVAEGLDLSHLANVVFVEHGWEAGMLAQAMNRVHRPGNTHACTNVYHVVVKRTVDAVLYSTVTGRGATMQEIVDSALVPWVDPDEFADSPDTERC